MLTNQQLFVFAGSGGMKMDDRFETFTMAVLRLNKLVQRIKLLEMGGLKPYM